jgi:uncharacterized membrane protein (UPF0127 family)
MAREAPAVSVYNESKQTLLATRVLVADTGFSRLIGLLGRRSLEADTGIWIVPANAIHTFGMLFRFDLVLIDRTYKVVGLRERIRPFLMTWPNFRARSVLELPAFTTSISHTAVGDQLRMDPI